jgi:hypothetical protein
MDCVEERRAEADAPVITGFGGVMSEKPDLFVAVQGDEIVVRTLGFYAVYCKPTNQPQLILKRRSETDDYELLAQAWQAANDKARELGWIVLGGRPSGRPFYFGIFASRKSRTVASSCSLVTSNTFSLYCFACDTELVEMET